MVRHIFSFISITASLWACEKPADQITLGNFYPLEDGFYREYEVQKIAYSVAAEPEESRFFLREKFSPIDVDTYRLDTYTKEQKEDPWELSNTSILSLNRNWLIQTAGDVPEILLQYPVNNGVSWDRNALNSKKPEEWHISGFDQNHRGFPHSFQAISVLDSSLIDKNILMGIYTEGVGLTYFENTSLKYCQSTPDCIGLGKIDSGDLEIWKILDYGINK